MKVEVNGTALAVLQNVVARLGLERAWRVAWIVSLPTVGLEAAHDVSGPDA